MDGQDKSIGAMLRHYKVARWPWTQILLVLILLTCYRGLDYFETIHKQLSDLDSRLVDIQNADSQSSSELKDSVDEVKSAVDNIER